MIFSTIIVCSLFPRIDQFIFNVDVATRDIFFQHIISTSNIEPGVLDNFLRSTIMTYLD